MLLTLQLKESDWLIKFFLKKDPAVYCLQETHLTANGQRD
jgi:hypothetical protein